MAVKAKTKAATKAKPKAKKPVVKKAASKKTATHDTQLTIQLVSGSASWKNAFPKLKQKVEQATALSFLRAKKPSAFKNRDFDITVILATDSVIKKLNHNYRGKNKATNVLSFPQMDLTRFKKSDLAMYPSAAPVPLGDVVLAYQTMRKEAKEQKKTLEEHTIHLIIHGVLHLFGYDHMNDRDAKIMEKLECDILETLGYADPYRDIV